LTKQVSKNKGSTRSELGFYVKGKLRIKGCVHRACWFALGLKVLRGPFDNQGASHELKSWSFDFGKKET